MLKNIIKLDLAPGGDLPVWENLQREMSILNILPTSTQVVRKTQRKEKTIGTQSIIVHMTTVKRWMSSKKDPTSQQAPTSRARRISQCMQCSYLHYLGIRTNTYQWVWANRRIMDYQKNNTLPFTRKIISGRQCVPSPLTVDTISTNDLCQMISATGILVGEIFKWLERIIQDWN